jgi:hypothetical protein
VVKQLILLLQQQSSFFTTTIFTTQHQISTHMARAGHAGMARTEWVTGFFFYGFVFECDARDKQRATAKALEASV